MKRCSVQSERCYSLGYTHGTLQQGFVPDPLVNGAFSLVSLALTNPIPDEVIGQTLRAQWAGVNALQNALEKMKQIKSGVKSPYKEENEAI
jgi:hypothetical protein